MTGPNHLAEVWYYNITCDVTARAGRSVRTACAEGLTNRNLLPDDLRGLAWEPLPFSLILKDNTDEGWMRRVSGTPASANSIAFDIDENLDYYPLCRGCLGVLRARFPFNPTVKSELLPFLKTVPLFADLSDSALAVIASVARVKPVPKDVVIFEKDDEGDAAYVVRKGTIAITLSFIDGRELVIYEMHSGDCFGELALLTNQPRSARAIAREASEVIAIPRSEFMAELRSQPLVMQHLNEIIAQRLRQSTERESALAFLDADTRLARVLLRLDRESSAEGYVTISQDEISRRTGVARQTAAKTLGKWRRAGWIITGRGKIVVLDHAALRRLADKL